MKQIIEIAGAADEREWANVLTFLKNYQGNDDDIAGVKLFLEHHRYSRPALLAFEKDIAQKTFPAAKSRLIRIPAWVMVVAASFVLATGLYINSYVQHKSLHVVEGAMPVYLSDDDASFNKAMSLYKKGDYERASFIFRKINSDTAVYYSAVCYEMLHYLNLSKETFSRIEAGSGFYNRARIRLAAIYIDAGDQKKAAGYIRNLKPANREEAARIRSVKVRLK